MNNKEYSLIHRLFSEQIEVSGYSHKELMETVCKLVEEKEKLFGKDNVMHDFKKRTKAKDENGKEIFYDTYRFTYFVRWINDLKQKEAEIKNLRILSVCKEFGADKETITERMRKLYV